MVTIGLVTFLTSCALAFIAGHITRHALNARDRQALQVKPRVVVEYDDGLGPGEWCTFESLAQAQEAIPALNEVYRGRKRFWLQGALDPDAAPLEAPAAAPLEAPAAVAEPVRPLPRPAPKARPKPGTPIVRQSPSGNWTVTAGAFTIGYGRGEEGYRAALAAVARAHRPVS